MNDNDQLNWLPPHRVVSQVSIMAERLDYAHKMMNVPHMWQTTRGSGVKVVVIDTGVPAHVDIRQAGGGSTIIGYETDRNGHATHVGGIIAAIANNGIGVAGIAPEVDDYYIAALGASGNGSVNQIARAIRMAVDEYGADVINLSLGVTGAMTNNFTLESACDYAVSQGAVIVAASGNENSIVGQPACYDSVIAVAAVDSHRDRAWFSNQGPEVDFAAPGVDVYSTYLNNRYAKLSGTSMACPMVTAIAALIIADGQTETTVLTPAEVKAKIAKIAFDIGPAGEDTSFGHGLPIFGHANEEVPIVIPPRKPVPVPPAADDEPRGKAKSMPEIDCIYWRMFGDFIDGFGDALDHNCNMETALNAGLQKLRRHKTAVNILLRK